jgi:hypothetical protein
VADTKEFVIRLVQRAGPIAMDDSPPDLEGLYLESFDPEYRDPDDVTTPAWFVGQALWTDDPARARRFDQAMDAWRCYTTVSTTQPTRPDGKPNRPLTAFTILVEAAP